MTRRPQEDLDRLLDAFGADPARWPPDRRAAALERLAASAEAHEAVAEAARLDGLLDLAPAPAVGEDRVERVVAAALARTRTPAPRRNGLPAWAAWPALPRFGWLGGAALAGLALGLLTVPPAVPPGAPAVPAEAGLDVAGLLLSPYPVERLVR